MSELRALPLPQRARFLVAATTGILTATASGSLVFTVIAKPSFAATRLGVSRVVTSFLEAYFVSSVVALTIALFVVLPALILCGKYHVGSGLQWAICSAIGIACGLIGWALEALSITFAFGLLWLFFLLPGMWVGIVAYPVSKLLARTPSVLLPVGLCLTCLFIVGLVTISLH